MCDGSAGPAGAAETVAGAPRPAEGPAVDPIALEPVDEVVITTLVDNVYDALLTGDERIKRTPFGAGLARAPQFESGATSVGLMAEHGFSALVSVRRAGRTSTVLFDAGLSPEAMLINADRLGVDLDAVQGIVLSHGHFDHAGGLAALAARRGRAGLPMTVHPQVWTRRRLAPPGADVFVLPTLSRHALEAEGFAVLERRVPSLLLDDQALVVHVRGQGLVVLTGCGHGGAVNIARHAQRLTGVTRLHALLGGLHLAGPAFEPIIDPTVEALRTLAPDLLVPGHCTGWRAQHAFAAALPDSWVQGSAGSSYRLAAA